MPRGRLIIFIVCPLIGRLRKVFVKVQQLIPTEQPVGAKSSVFGAKRPLACAMGGLIIDCSTSPCRLHTLCLILWRLGEVFTKVASNNQYDRRWTISVTLIKRPRERRISWF